MNETLPGHNPINIDLWFISEVESMSSFIAWWKAQPAFPDLLTPGDWDEQYAMFSDAAECGCEN